MAKRWKLHLTAVDQDNRVAMCFIETDAEWIAANLEDSEAVQAGFKLTEIIAYDYESPSGRRKVSYHVMGGRFVITISTDD